MRAVMPKPATCCSGLPAGDRTSQPTGFTRLNAANSARSYAIFSTPHRSSGAAIAPAANIAPVSVGPMAEARLRGTAVKLAAAGRSAGVTTDMTKAERAGTSICDKALRASNSASASSRVGANAAPMRHRFAGMWVNTMVLMRPMRRATAGAASCEAAVKRPVQKKNAPAAVSDMPKRSNSHNARSAFTARPPAKESTLKSAASFQTMAREGPSGTAGLASSARGGGSRR